MNAYAPKDLARMLSPSISQLQTYQAPAPMQGAPIQPAMPQPMPKPTQMPTLDGRIPAQADLMRPIERFDPRNPSDIARYAYQQMAGGNANTLAGRNIPGSELAAIERQKAEAERQRYQNASRFDRIGMRLQGYNP